MVGCWMIPNDSNDVDAYDTCQGCFLIGAVLIFFAPYYCIDIAFDLTAGNPLNEIMSHLYSVKLIC